MWEYLVLEWKLTFKNATWLQDQLNEYGRAGWECVGLTSAVTTSVVVVLKRALAGVG